MLSKGERRQDINSLLTDRSFAETPGSPSSRAVCVKRVLIWARKCNVKGHIYGVKVLSFNGVSISGIPVRKVLFSDFVLGFDMIILIFMLLFLLPTEKMGKRGSSGFPACISSPGEHRAGKVFSITSVYFTSSTSGPHAGC